MANPADSLRFFQAIADAKARGETDESIGDFFQGARSQQLVGNAMQNQLDKDQLDSMFINDKYYDPKLSGRFGNATFTGDYQEDLAMLSDIYEGGGMTPAQKAAAARAEEDLAYAGQPTANELNTKNTADYRSALDLLHTMHPNTETYVPGEGGKGKIFLDVGTDYFRQGDETVWGEGGAGANLGKYASVVQNNDGSALQDLAGSPLGTILTTAVGLMTGNPWITAATQGGVTGVATGDVTEGLKAAGTSLATSLASDFVNSSITGHWEGNFDDWLPGDATAAGSLEKGLQSWADDTITPVTDSLFGTSDYTFYDAAGKALGTVDGPNKYTGPASAIASEGVDGGLLGGIFDNPIVAPIVDKVADVLTALPDTGGQTSPKYTDAGPSVVPDSPAFDPSIQIPADTEMENVSQDELFMGEFIPPEFRLDPDDISIPGLPEMPVEEEEEEATGSGSGGGGGYQEAVQGDRGWTPGTPLEMPEEDKSPQVPVPEETPKEDKAPQVPTPVEMPNEDETLEDILETIEEDEDADTPLTPDVPTVIGENPPNEDGDTPFPQIPNIPGIPGSDGGGSGPGGTGGLTGVGEPEDPNLLGLFSMPWIKKLTPMQKWIVADAVARRLK